MKRIISTIAITLAMVCMFSMSTPKKADAKVKSECKEVVGILLSCGTTWAEFKCDTSGEIRVIVHELLEAYYCK